MKYRRDNFRYSEDKGVFHNASAPLDKPPSVIIKGERMAHADFSEDAFGFHWACCKHDHWHCRVDLSFTEALEWVREGKGEVENWWIRQDTENAPEPA